MERVVQWGLPPLSRLASQFAPRGAAADAVRVPLPAAASAATVRAAAAGHASAGVGSPVAAVCWVRAQPGPPFQVGHRTRAIRRTCCFGRLRSAGGGGKV
jgi:hypothetical protein